LARESSGGVGILRLVALDRGLRRGNGGIIIARVERDENLAGLTCWLSSTSTFVTWPETRGAMSAKCAVT
jgi:hypothetical protein